MNSWQVIKPIILIGTGRCGSTALHKLLSLHPHVSWLSDLCNRYPNHPEFNRWLMQAFSLPRVGRLLNASFNPGENYLFWETYSHGFRRPFRDLTACDVTNREKSEVQQAMGSMLTRQRNRLLLKITGWPRIGYLKEIFPQAKFIHIVRDGRAVANSMLAVDFWDGWLGPDRWRWGPLTPEQNKLWEATGKSFVGLAALEWVIMQDAVIKAKSDLASADFLEIRYEDFCADKLDVTKKILQFAELEWTVQYVQSVRHFPVESRNYKWKTDLTTEQQSHLEIIQEHFLRIYGYFS